MEPSVPQSVWPLLIPDPGAQTGGVTRAKIEVEVRDPATKHTVTLQQIERWLSGATISPNERVKKDRLKAMLKQLRETIPPRHRPRIDAHPTGCGGLGLDQSATFTYGATTAAQVGRLDQSTLTPQTTVRGVGCPCHSTFTGTAALSNRSVTVGARVRPS